MPDDKTHILSIKNQWIRDPNGPSLPRPPPNGNRSSNGVIWGHTLNDFYWVQRQPGVKVYTIWSRSMIQEFGENYAGVEHEYEPVPRQFRPWPVLRLPPGITSDPLLGLVDETCFCNHIRAPLSMDLFDKDGNLLSEKPETISPSEPDSESEDSSDDDNESSVTDNKMTKEPDVNKSADVDSANIISESETKNEITDAPVTANGETPEKPLAAAQNQESVTVDPSSSKDSAIDEPKATTSSNQTKTPKTKIHWENFPKLEEFIPDEYFPDILLVNDPAATITGKRVESSSPKPKTSSSAKPIKYKRVWPNPDDSPNGDQRVAHLNLDSAPLLGEGNHSFVYRALLRLPEPLTARSPTGEVTVAAKMAMPAFEARELLKNEGKIYNEFPRQLMEHWCGLNLVSPIRNPVPVGAVVPKFYGYYRHDDDHNNKGSWGSSPILLVEECGEQVNPLERPMQERTEIFSLLLRLHHAGFIQQSLYTRNMLMQPGPLTKPPDQRSDDTPSFRLIDFGRAESWALTRTSTIMDHIDPVRFEPKLSSRAQQWYRNKDYEVGKARGGTILNYGEY